MTQTADILNRHADRLRAQGVLPLEGGTKVLMASALGDDIRSSYRRLGWGRMWSSGLKIDPYPGEPWGLDNGAYAAAKAGRPFPENKFVRRVEAARQVAEERDTPPLLAVVPDIVQGGMGSLEFSLAWIDRVRDLAPDWQWYLALQDGFTREVVEDVVDQFDGLLLGGGDGMKHAAAAWSEFAHSRSVPLHYARGGTVKKVRHAFRVGADSLDTTFPVRDPNRLDSFVRVVVRSHRIQAAQGRTPPS